MIAADLGKMRVPVNDATAFSDTKQKFQTKVKIFCLNQQYGL